MATKQEQEDEDEGGDLGLGRGLKPGAIALNSDDSCCDDQFTMLVRTHLPHNTQAQSTSRRLSERLSSIPGIPTSTKNQRKPKKSSHIKSSNSTDDKGDPERSQIIYTEVPIDKLVRQQHQKSVEDKIHGILQESDDSDDHEEITGNNDSKARSQQRAEVILQKKLKRAESDLEQLRQDLELCRSQLEAKYRAISIMQKQSFAVHTQHLDATTKTKQLNRKLIKELNRVQFELEHKQGTLIDSQELWSERFDRVCLENMALTATIETKSEGIKKLTNEKLLLRQERDELLALLDIQERHRYEFAQALSVSSDEDQYSGFTSAELSVLGACRCRIQSPEPCCCALLAAQMRREIVRIKEQLETARHDRDEARVTADAYRIAFEEQLAQNRLQMQQIATLSTSSPQMKQRSKLKAALKWIIQQLNEAPPSVVAEDESIMLLPGLRLPPGIILQNERQPAKSLALSSGADSKMTTKANAANAKPSNRPVKAVAKSEVKSVPAVSRSDYQPLATKPVTETRPSAMRSRAEDEILQENSGPEVQPLLEQSAANGNDGCTLPSLDDVVDGSSQDCVTLTRQPSSESVKSESTVTDNKPGLVTWRDVKRRKSGEVDSEADREDGLNSQLDSVTLPAENTAIEKSTSSAVSSEYESLCDTTERTLDSSSLSNSRPSSIYSSCDNLALSDTNTRSDADYSRGRSTSRSRGDCCNGLDWESLGDGSSAGDVDQRGDPQPTEPSIESMRQVVHSKNMADITKLVDSLSNQSEKHLMATLIEMISDRSEALAHQRLAARMLAIRTQELERKLKAITEEVFDVPDESCANSIT